MKNLIIIGVGGFAREVYWHAQNSVGNGSQWKVKGFLDGNVKVSDREYELLDALLLGDVEHYEIQQDDVFICAIANPQIKMMITEILEEKKGKFINLIHHTALVSDNAVLGQGIILCPFAIISCNVRVGNHVMFNSRSGAGHDAVIGDYTSVMSGVDITGGVHVGVRTYWGNGSCALPHSRIGNDSIIGAGSVVLKKVKENETVFGIPAKKIF